MTSTNGSHEDPDLLASRWDLSSLVEGDGSEGVERLLDEAETRAKALAESTAGRLAQLDGAGLTRAMRELAAIKDLTGRAGAYADLSFMADTSDPARGALAQRAQERVAEIDSLLLFMELEWVALDDAAANALLEEAGDDLAFAAHHLRRVRVRRPHLLSPAEERILSEKAVASRGAWVRLFNEISAAVQVELDGEKVSVEEAASRLMHPDRSVRQAASEALTAAMTPSLRHKAFIYNTLLHEQAVDDRLRSYRNWLARRNLSNEASDESVMALIEAVHGRVDIAKRWFRLKARLFDLERLADYDLMAPLGADEQSVGYADARRLVLDTYERFSPKAGAIVRRFFDESWIDAPPGEGKAGGAFCHPTVPSAHPYILLNYAGQMQDVLTLAHELGHGIHGVLAQPQGVFHHSETLTVAETASGFGETLVGERLMDEATDDRQRLTILGWRIDNAVLVIYEAMAANRFEHLVHTRRRRGHELSVDQLTEAWVEAHDSFGDTVELTERGRIWWSYYPHFVTDPGYMYAYPFGQLLALAALSRYRELGDEFVPAFFAMLGAGGSRSPEDLAEMIGVDLTDPGFWDAGLRIVEDQVSSAEKLADAVSAGSNA